MLGTKDGLCHAYVPLLQTRVGKCLRPSLQLRYNAMDPSNLQLCILLGAFWIASRILAFPSTLHPRSSLTRCSEIRAYSNILYMWMYEWSMPLGTKKLATSWFKSSWNSERIWLWNSIMCKLLLRGDKLDDLCFVREYFRSLFLYSNYNLCSKRLGHDKT